MLEQNEDIEKLTQKHPNLRKYAYFQLKSYPFEVVSSFIETYKKHKNSLKGKLNFKKNVEDIIDDALEILTKIEFEKFIKKNVSKDLRNTLNKKSLLKIEELYFTSEDTKKLSKDMFSSIAYCKNGADVNDHIKQYYNLNTKFNIEKTKKDINNKDSSLYVEDGELIIIEIKTYNGIKRFGSNKWCISNYRDYFEYYISELKRQYVLYDFSKESGDELSIIGVTVNSLGEVVDAFDKNNNDLSNAQFIHDHIFPKLVLQDLYKMTEVRDVTEVIVEADNAGEYIFIKNFLKEKELDIEIIDRIIDKVVIYGDSEVLSEILKQNLIDKTDVKYINKFASYAANDAFEMVMNEIEVNSKEDLDLLWETMIFLISNQMDDEFEIIIKKISKIKNYKTTQEKNIVKILNHIKFYSDFCYYFGLILDNFKNINLKILNWELDDILMLNDIPEKYWGILIKTNAIKEIRFPDECLDSIDLLKSEKIIYTKNKERINNILKSNLQ